MSGPKRLVIFVEGDGDELAVPVLVKHILTEQNAWDCLYLDKDPFRIGGIEKLTGRKADEWTKKLKAAAKPGRLGAVLLVLDGDAEKIEGARFCAATVAQLLAERARQPGGGAIFSVAVVFACMEYESWLLASLPTLAGKVLPDGRPGIRAGVSAATGDLETAPRNAKKELGRHMETAYKPTTDQEPLTKLLVQDLSELRRRGLRSFRRLQDAIQLLTNAVRTGKHIVSPSKEPT